jgi:ribosome-associated translation inhibitor RaiA
MQIHFLDMAPSPAVEARIQGWAARLTRQFHEIQTCQIWVASPHGHHRKGDVYRVRIRLTVPGDEIAIDFQPSEDDVHLSIRKAFEAARRKLQDYKRRRRGQVKAHPRAGGDASRRRLVVPGRDREGSDKARSA